MLFKPHVAVDHRLGSPILPEPVESVAKFRLSLENLQGPVVRRAEDREQFRPWFMDG